MNYNKLASADKAALLREIRICQVCGMDRASQIDHDHVSGEARGCVCARCNSAIGWVEKLSPVRLTQLQDYVASPPLHGRNVPADEHPLTRAVLDWKLGGGAEPLLLQIGSWPFRFKFSRVRLPGETEDRMQIEPFADDILARLQARSEENVPEECPF